MTRAFPLWTAGSAMPRIMLAATVAAGCAGKDLPGYYYAVSLKGADNQCTGGGAGYTEDYEYRADIDGNDLILAVGEDVFATGTVEGCNFVYDSLSWSDYRDNRLIEWQIRGTARVNVGGAGCVNGTDWEGEETFIVTASDHEDVSPGCTYSLDVSGKFLREVE